MNKIASFLDARIHVLEHVVEGGKVSDTLDILCRETEEIDPAMRCSILIYDQDANCLRHAAGPSLPDYYNDAMDGLQPGLGVGSCGTAAFTGERVIVEDVLSHPYWQAFRDLAKKVGFHACWSQPIYSKSKEVLGTFAMYYDEVRRPTEEELQLIQAQANLASLVIERKQTEEALGESKERFKDFADASSDWFWEMGPDLRFTSYSPRVEEAIGVSLDWLIGKTRQEQGRPEIVDEKWIHHLDALKAHEPFKDFEYALIRADGTKVYVRTSGVPVFGDDGDFLGYRGTGTNITEHKRNQEALKESEERFKDFADASSDWFWEMGPDLRFTYHSTRYFEITGFSLTDKIGTERTRYVDPSSLEEDVEKWDAHFDDLKDRKSFKNFEFDFIGKHGKSISARISGKPVFDEKEEFLGYRGTGTDITERKQAEDALRQSERRFRGFAETASDWFWEMDADLRFTYFSPRNREITGFEPELYLGKSRREIVHGNSNDEYWRQHLADLDAHREFRDFEYDLKISGSRILTISINGRPDFDADGIFLGYHGTGRDITERKQAVVQAEIVQKQLHDAIDTMSEGFALFDKNDRLVLCNNVYREMYSGHAEAIVPGNSFEDILRTGLGNGAYVDAIGNEEAWLATRLKQHRGLNLPVEQRLSNGRWLLISERRTKDGGTVGVRTDITKLKQAEGMLRNSIESITEGFVLWDAEDRLILCNSRYRKMYPNVAHLIVPGVLFEDLMRESVRLNQYQLDAGETPEDWISKRLEKHRTLGGVHEQNLVDGRWLLVAERKMPDGGTVGTRTDISDLKRTEMQLRESEERFKDFATSASDWYWEMGPDLRFSYFSERFENAIGISPDKLIGKTRGQDRQLEIDEDKWANHLAALNAHEPFKDFEYGLRREDGTITYVRVSGRPVFRNEGDFLGYRGTGTDITKHTILEEQLRRSQRMEAVGQLTGGIAHDFNNLLGVMIGNAEILGTMIGEDKKARQKIDALIKAVDRGASLTSRLLAFSRQQALSPQPTAINGLVLGLEDMLQRTLGETIELSTRLEQGACEALIDPHQFEDSLVNLAINARDAMPGGGVLAIETANVTLEEAYTEQYEEVTPGEYVKVAVSDTGIGMTTEILEKVFEPFFTTKEVGAGSGLGLSMVYGFIKQSKGHVTIDSKVDRGTTVQLYLPRVTEIATQEDATDEIAEFELGSERILVVEDDEDLREIPVSILRDQGYKVVEAKDGNEAIKYLRDGQQFDLLFTDVVLPGGMNGVEIAKEVKRIQPDIKVLFTTGYAENAVAHIDMLDPGITLVNKPYRREELLEKVRTTLDSDTN